MQQRDRAAVAVAEEPGLLVQADGLPDEGGKECTGNTEHDGQDEAARIVRAGRQEAREKACDSANDQNIKHC